MSKPTILFDWDDTLVGWKKYGEKGEWLDGAQDVLLALRRTHDLGIHSCRASWDGGREEIRVKLAEIGLVLPIYEKPLAHLYVDDRGFRFDGDYSDLLPTLRRLSS